MTTTDWSSLPLRWLATLTLFILSLFLFPAAAQDKIALVGSGSNVPSPLYSVWSDAFNKSSAAVSVRYVSMSTMEGIQNVTKGTGDFAGGEIPLTEEQSHGGQRTVIELPSVIVGLVPVYNLPGTPQLRFSGKVLSQIFMGEIKNWKDPQLAKLNPGVSLPDLPIKIVHRTGGKGSNYIFTEFLSKSDPAWKSKIGISPSPNWPLGDEANRGEDMVAKVAASSGAIGYVEASFARHASLGYGDVENPAGQFIRATQASLAASCAAMEKSMHEDFRVSMTNAPGKDSYPIASFTWLYIPVSGLAPERSRALKQFLDWAFDQGQSIAKDQGYAPLPPGVLEKVRAKVKTIQ
jgi:phosphate transport system substrate-binding protein